MSAKDEHARMMRLVRAAMRKMTADELDVIAKLAVQASGEKRPMEVRESFAFLKEAAELPSDSFDFKLLLRIVLAVSGLDRDRVLGTRQPDAVKARHILFWLCATYTKLSTTQIGARALRDHSTVLYGIARVQSARQYGALTARANPVSWAIALWDADWPAPFAADGSRLPRRLPAQAQP